MSSMCLQLEMWPSCSFVRELYTPVPMDLNHHSTIYQKVVIVAPTTPSQLQGGADEVQHFRDQLPNTSLQARNGKMEQTPGAFV
jgi:hypothetical protein